MDRAVRTSRGVRGTTPAIVAAARDLRGAMTPAERVLWSAIRRQQIEHLRFRRQHPLGRFILDFCCVSHRLVIEVDGPVHEDQGDHDQARTEALGVYGYRVLRFTNEQVLHDLPTVLAVIRSAATPST